jgi:hypothetical protein
MTDHFEIIMKEMFKRVGEQWDEEYPKQKQWFSKHSWTQEEQNDFNKWMVDYLYNNLEARKQVLTSRVKNKRMIQKAVNWFLLDFGWKLKED